MTSAFGIDHGDEVSKGLKDAIGTAKLHGKLVNTSRKLHRAHRVKALTDAGYPTKAGANIKESFKAGVRGRAGEYRSGQKAAFRAAKKRTRADIDDVFQGRKAGRRIDPGLVDRSSASFYRSMSRGEY